MSIDSNCVFVCFVLSFLFCSEKKEGVKKVDKKEAKKEDKDKRLPSRRDDKDRRISKRKNDRDRKTTSRKDDKKIPRNSSSCHKPSGQSLKV